MHVLVSGASVAGPVLAYWLAKAGYTPLVVERAARPRVGTGGHAVDLFAPGMAVAERMGIADAVREKATQSTRLRLERPGKSTVEVDHSMLLEDAGTARHVEIMRGDLAEILHEATRSTVEYAFGDSIASLDADDDGVDVTFDSGRTGRFGLVIGADGLHSNVRRLAFGAENRFLRYLGGYLAVFTVPNYRDLSDEVVLFNAPGRLVAMYRVPNTDEARVLMLFRRRTELRYDREDLAAQKRVLCQEFADVGWEVPRLLDALADTDDFYLDSISQIRLNSWSRGRVALVGDAGFSPGPAVGGGTTLAAASAYVLARALADAEGEHRAAFAAYEDQIRDYVLRCRAVAPKLLRSGIPQSRAQVWANAAGMRLLPWLPAAIRRRLGAAPGATKALSTFELPPPR
ncbi:2-polyprenyl-6-methoxyphenol hydroxylase-like FAD-dependent oxidoreductase [Tamaricihabitans halophyticus]|uniref:2-polyprenyl-6-methoxyphenol hydroxylase-like FAD-dependent oxidoreductase n=1 Tax=Tamaricihabitans halophyticus TaxID=1262583 RepID=A0A4R2Q4A7_9PSEU|nr:FAD-dependent monooxygenase [Tamaricihabitans halophyticus]TCP43430.1 2-polyprenyl-6-methoxyphenol hydroxylase-like FAD-dependent oxidoreductase [Tamaricihabitans halophyticus]